jgi:mono/diheme cytochrome c family protein
MKRMVLLVLAMALAACSAPPISSPAPAGTGGAMPMGMGSGMHQRHSAPIPTEYAGLTSPVAADQESLTRGAAIYSTNCATCHGDGGMGDGPASTGLNPLPAPIAHTSQMMGDDYLFWRISEGGAAFHTAMLPWKGTLDKQARWDVINYVRALGSGKATPATTVGGAPYDPEVDLARQKEMLARAVESGVITPAEADIFSTVHAALDQQRIPPAKLSGDTSDARQAARPSALVADGLITQAQAGAFTDIHDRLAEAGLME